MAIPEIGILAVFLAGAILFLSPCVLPLVPGYVSYIAGQPDLRTMRNVGLRARAGVLGSSSCFVLGFSTVFVALGAVDKDCRALLDLWSDECRSGEDVKRIADVYRDAIEQKIVSLQSLKQTLRDLVMNCTGDNRPESPIPEDLARGPSSTRGF